MLSKVYVFVENYPFNVENEEIYPQERADEIKNCRNFDVKNQKFFAWKLLEKACKKLGFEFKKINFYKEKNKWKCDKFYFSISHSKNAVALAISDEKIGIDIEKKDISRFEKLGKKIICNISEIIDNHNLGEQLNILWTAKEALFKCGENLIFKPSKEDTTKANIESKMLRVGEEKFFLSVACFEKISCQYDLGENVSFS